MTLGYVDTSALAKRFLGEPKRDEFNIWYAQMRPVWTSDLTRLEMDSLLARRLAEKQINAAHVDKVTEALDAEVGIWCMTVAVDPADLASARRLVSAYGAPGLRSLDALHLATALRLHATELATADRAMAKVALALGMTVAWFGVA